MQVVTKKALLDKGELIPAGTVIELDADVVKELGAAVEPIGESAKKAKAQKGVAKEVSGETEPEATDTPPSDEQTNVNQE